MNSDRSEEQDVQCAETEATAVCRICKREFQAKTFLIMSARLTITVCPKCGEEMERAAAAQEARRRQREIEDREKARELFWSAFCPVEFRLPTEAGGKTEIAKLELRQPKLKELMGWSGNRGLIIRGVTGTCKTRSVWRLARRLWNERRSFVVLTPGEFERQFRDAAGHHVLTEWFKTLQAMDVFILDDLGKSPWSPATEAQWFDLVDARTRDDRPIIVTTNDTGETLAARMAPERAEALIRRLRDYCDQMVFV